MEWKLEDAGGKTETEREEQREQKSNFTSFQVRKGLLWQAQKVAR